MDNIFIYTEIVNCGKIGKICLESLHKYHPDIEVNIFGTSKDFEWIDKQPNYVYHEIKENILNGFNTGHLGTAMLWASLIKERSEKFLIHFDSDVVFRKECFSDLFEGIDNGYDIIGTIRNYTNNPHAHRNDVKHLSDLTQTLFFAFNRELVSEFDVNTLTDMCRGTYDPLGHPVLDFFDPVEFDILKNGGKILLLDKEEYGGCNDMGQRSNQFLVLNELIDFGEKLAHFSAVGSGMNFLENSEKIVNVPDSYVKYSIEKYGLYCKLFYDEIIDESISLDRYAPLFEIKEWY